MGHQRIVFLGPPASGKGTAAMGLSRALGVPHVSTGQMFRDVVGRGGPLSEVIRQFIDKGQLVPDEVTVQVVRLWLDEHSGEWGFIFDGFPRTLAQAQAFDRILAERGEPVTLAVLLEVSRSIILERVLGRLVCEKCGALFHARSVPPRAEGTCDQCGGKLTRRADDTAATVVERLQWYDQLTVAVVQHYEAQGILRRVDGSEPKEAVLAKIMELAGL